jgi:alkylated DNA repair dioxygenase AlkB
MELLETGCDLDFNKYLQCFECEAKTKEIEELCAHVHELLKLVQKPETATTATQTESVEPNCTAVEAPILAPSSTTQSRENSLITTPTPTPHFSGNIAAPYRLLPEKSFAMFDLDILDKHTSFTRTFLNRSTAYYGVLPYRYGSTYHGPVAIPTGNYLHEILHHLQTLMPDYHFNSVLLNKYIDGKDCIGYHSDDEPEISPDSNIVTISLGETRAVIFRSSSGKEQSVTFGHGDAHVMSKASQEFYTHCIPKDSSMKTRISITCRMLTNPSDRDRTITEEQFMSTQDLIIDTLQHLSVHSDHHAPADTPQHLFKAPVSTAAAPPVERPLHITQPPSAEHQDVRQVSAGRNITKKTTVYISSSMFSELNARKLSSSNQTAIVLFYRGATASEILCNLQTDANFLGINPLNVDNIFLMCGTNNVDRVVGAPHHRRSSLVGVDEFEYHQHELGAAMDSITNLVYFLHEWARAATINILNLLPRVSRARNIVINKLNGFMLDLCTQNSNFLRWIGTESSRHLFTDRGALRTEHFFNQKGSDNVHLSFEGVARLARHLKFLAHI